MGIDNEDRRKLADIEKNNLKKLGTWTFDTDYPILSGVWFRPKCYSLKLMHEKEKLRCKGVSLRNTEISHDTYLDFLSSGGLKKYCNQTKFINRNFDLTLSTFEKVAITKLDLKRYELYPKGPIQTLALGHRDIPLINDVSATGLGR